MQEILDLLIEKNTKYGNSAISPANIFCKRVDPLDQLYVQIDHKLARISRGDAAREDEDVLVDLVGYLILAIVAKRKSDSVDIPLGSFINHP